MRCGDMDWSQLGNDGKFQDSSIKVARKQLEQNLRMEGKWEKGCKQLKKPQLLEQVLRLVHGERN